VTDREKTSWPMLNAYVDGELPRDEAAEVAAAISVDREAAAKVATLTRLRAAVAETASVLAPPFVLPQRQSRLRRWSLWAAAASLALFVAGAAFQWVGGDQARDGRLSTAIAAHRQWLAHSQPGAAPRLNLDLAGADVGSLPDLSLASLRLVHLSMDPSGHRGGGMLAGYVGPNGCRVGLWIAPVDKALATQPTVLDQDGLAIRAWRSERASYAVLGAIDPARLDGIASLVARITRNEPGVPREQIAALAEARSVGSTCSG